jgi:WhiB family redox-sensing transcriptional regulator
MGTTTWHPSFQPRWNEMAACRTYPTWWWFTDSVEAVEAFGVCAECAVQAECLAFALDRPDVPGIWAGTTEEDRQEMRRVAGAHRRLSGSRDAGPHPSGS